MLKAKDRSRTAAALIGAVLILLCAASLLSILLPQSREDGFTADIFQDGKLIASISLQEVQNAYSFTVTGDNGGINVIEVRPGCIGIVTADCPDKLCVRQGFISDSRLPVTCLPNRVVILLRPRTEAEYTITPDIITY